ncbi:NUDIX domain-containing protein [Micromonospora sp. WMMD812]|uniref:NUDIX hydrolase n=1 Tax=Micromonospora sp. WMMD812 TaxID=3015152 RepID=UPI00248D1243|nr:NUDIX domain-containing protein [Micromonospora sp. WMMD812]WBB70590.1 NUDIX domain-containing protein [Micromonospora sp. WMMD812]
MAGHLIEHYHDPDAPKANSIVVAVSVFVRDDRGRVLLIHRTDNDLWSLPGGGQEIGETVAQTAVRETREETGIDVRVIGLVGVYSDPAHVVEYSDGEVRQQFSLCFRAAPRGGTLTPSDESADVRWVPLDQIGDLDIHPSTQLRIKHGLEERSKPYIG